MAVNNNIVSAPISIREVAQLIGYGGNDLGTLCRHNNINKWSKHKPVRYASVAKLTDTELNWLTYGLSVASKNIVSELESYINNGGEGFIYLRPSGGSSEPFRLSDFDRYIHVNSDGGVDGGVYCKASVKQGDTITCSVTYSRPNAKNILVSDMKVGTRHLGMVFFRENFIPKVCACSQSLDEMAKEEDDESVWAEFSIEYPTSESATFKVLPVLTSCNIPSLVNANSAYHAIPLSNRFFNVKIVPNTIVDTGVVFGYSVQVNASSNNTTLTFTIANNGDRALTVSDLYFGIMTEESYDNDSDFLEDIADGWTGDNHTAPYDYGNPIVFRVFHIYQILKNANGGSNVIANGQTLTFTYSMAYTTDGNGYSYANNWGCFYRNDSACNFNDGYFVD